MGIQRRILMMLCQGGHTMRRLHAESRDRGFRHRHPKVASGPPDHALTITTASPLSRQSSPCFNMAFLAGPSRKHEPGGPATYRLAPPSPALIRADGDRHLLSPQAMTVLQVEALLPAQATC